MAQEKVSSALTSPLLGASLALNLSLLLFWASRVYFDVSTSESVLSTSNGGSSWTRAAAAEAEVAGSFNCSGRGVIYAEMIFHGLEAACECEQCFTGSHCEHVVPDCDVLVHSGDPLMYLPYWRQNHETSSILIPGWYRIGYELSQPLIPVLEKEIRDLHKLVGNAVTDGRYILVGSGEMQLMMAAYSTISMEADGLPVHTVIDPPYYDAYERQVKTIKPGTVRWGAPGLDSESSGNWIPLEIVISPNNPDGSLRTPTWKHRNENARTVHDNAYYWPHYTPITGPRDDDFMLFSLSKVTGHAGSRLGWAIIKDRAVYEKMLMSVRLNSVTVSHEAQFRAAHILRSIREGYSKVKSVGLNSSPTEYAAQQLLFHYGHAKMKTRWEQMLKLFQASDRFLIEQNLEQSYCNFFKDIVHPLPAFVWIRCQREEDQSCFEIFRDAGIHGRGGANCGMTNRYVRLAMMDGDHTFKHLLNRLQALVST